MEKGAIDFHSSPVNREANLSGWNCFLLFRFDWIPWKMGQLPPIRRVLPAVLRECLKHFLTLVRSHFLGSLLLLKPVLIWIRVQRRIRMAVLHLMYRQLVAPLLRCCLIRFELNLAWRAPIPYLEAGCRIRLPPDLLAVIPV